MICTTRLYRVLPRKITSNVHCTQSTPSMGVWRDEKHLGHWSLDSKMHNLFIVALYVPPSRSYNLYLKNWKCQIFRNERAARNQWNSEQYIIDVVNGALLCVNCLFAMNMTGVGFCLCCVTRVFCLLLSTKDKGKKEAMPLDLAFLLSIQLCS